MVAPEFFVGKKDVYCIGAKKVVLVQPDSSVESCGRRFFAGMKHVIFEWHRTVLPDVRRHIPVCDFVCLDSNAGPRSKLAPKNRREKPCLVSAGMWDAVLVQPGLPGGSGIKRKAVMSSQQRGRCSKRRFGSEG